MSLDFDEQTVRDAWFAEYRALRDDIMRRVQLQVQIVAFTVLITGAGIPLVLEIVSSKLFIFFLLIAPLYFAVGWLYFEQDIFLTQAATYLNTTLRPSIIKSLNKNGIRDGLDKNFIFYWEIFRNRALFGDLRKRIFIYTMTVFRLLVTVGPGLAAISGFLYYMKINPATARPWNGIEIFLLVCDIFLALVIIGMAARVVMSYRRINPD